MLVHQHVLELPVRANVLPMLQSIFETCPAQRQYSMSSVSLWNSGQRRAGSSDSFIPRVSHVNSLLMSCLVQSNMKSVAWNFFTLFLACSSVILSWIVLKRKVPSWLCVSTIYLDCPSPCLEDSFENGGVSYSSLQHII